jgi:hypothetical protein
MEDILTLYRMVFHWQESYVSPTWEWIQELFYKSLFNKYFICFETTCIVYLQ